MKDLIELVLKERAVIKNFDKELLMHWNESKHIQFDLANLLESKQMIDIPKEQAINYVELFNLIETEEDAEYFIELLKHNLHNRESIGLLLNAAYLVYYENLFTEGLQYFFNWWTNTNNSNPEKTDPFHKIAAEFLL